MEIIIKSRLLYGAETSRITIRLKEKLDAVEMDTIRRSLRISKRDRVRNEVVMQQMGIEGPTLEDVGRKQLVWYGHV